jgi:hypothetical protein
MNSSSLNLLVKDALMVNIMKELIMEYVRRVANPSV